MNRITVAISAVLMMVTSFSALAEGGRVLFVEGDAYAMRGRDRVALVKDSPLFIGDSLVTGPKGRLQYALDDNSLYAMLPNSTVNLDAFALAPTKAVRAGGGTLFMSMLKGAFRTVSGFVGKRRNDDYRINTPVATMGIRGTEYYAVLCQDDCQDRIDSKGGIKKTADGKVQNGLYISVDRGVVTATNDAGTFEIAAGQHGFIPSRKAGAQYLDRMPTVIASIMEGARFQFDSSNVDRARRSGGDSGPAVESPSPSTPGGGLNLPPLPRIEPPVGGTTGGNPPPPPPPPEPPVSPN